MKYLKIAITLLVLGGLVFWGYTTLSANKAEIDAKAEIKEEIISELPVRIELATAMEVDNNIELTGTFEARKELNIIAESQGRITKLYIKEGQNISKGQTVANIDDTNIQAQLNIIKATMEKSKKDVERYGRLLEAGAISQQQFEEINLNYQNALANVTSIEQQLKYSKAMAPMSGIVKMVNVEEGSFASPGSTLASIIDVSKLKMIVKIGETDIIKIKNGQKVKIKTEVYPQDIFIGRVSLISVEADAGRKYDVEIELDNPRKTPLKPGMFGTVLISSEADSNIGLFVSRKAIIGSVQSPKIYRVGENDIVELIDVKVGEPMEDKIEILDGLMENDVVVVSGQLNLSNNKKVKILNEEVKILDKSITENQNL
ncbi:efflux RND transporter periplasmic adaptor subunit [Portibacter lacus]|uniref:MexH family multidrug efflux RND transporter periplasmic adaptor subunit n=1 Tax=Portibacter lacus TaxID=1099794 RepID=A0AA37SXE8_9BACT|nr:efflux RND transporter periplasmic adaptor subunit [Portibacter lacus]GLR19475.1 MexH family multidrug efflux RND transporter periplasmic adaptor subunit [Portibacter lacus]